MSKKAPASALPRIVTVRKQKVVLDVELAMLYGVRANVISQDAISKPGSHGEGESPLQRKIGFHEGNR